MANDFQNNTLLKQSVEAEYARKRALLVDLASDSYGRVFTDESFSLPSDVDFFQEGFDIDLQNEMRASMRASFFLEAPFATNPGYYATHKAFVLRATPLIKEKLGTEASDYLREEAYLAKDLNRMDGDTIYFISDSVEDGSIPFVVGDKTFSSFSEMVKDSSTFSLRILGMNAPEITHYRHIPYADYNRPKTVFLKESLVRSDPAYIYQNRLGKGNRTIEFYEIDGTFCEVVDDNYLPEISERITDIDGNKLPNQSEYQTSKQKTKFMKFIYASDSTKETEDIGLKSRDDAFSLLSAAQDLRIVVDHKTLNRTSSSYDSPYNIDYNSINSSVFEKVWNYISKPWSQFFKEGARYPRYGYNLPGMDTYKRYLGAIYVKIKVSDLIPIAGISASELGLPSLNNNNDNYTGRYEMEQNKTYDEDDSTVWVNLAKLLIFKYEKYVDALPDYSGSPTAEYFSGFVSSAFRLWTYDLKNYVNLDEFISYTDDFIVERNQFFKNTFGLSYENLLSNYGIIGDTILSIPPSSIKCVTETQHQKAPLLRSRGPAIKSATQSSKVIELDLFFNEEEGINGMPIQTTLPNGQKITYWMNGLRSLLAQFHLTPFLPIENEYINKILNIEAVTLDSIQITTLEGFPRTLQAKLALREFNYRIYMPEMPLPDYEDENSWKINAFARTIHYPLFRWYYQRLLRLGNELVNYDAISAEYISKTILSGAPPLVPMKFESPNMKFYLPNKEYLDQRKQVAMDKAANPIRTGVELTDSMKEFMRNVGQLAENLQAAMGSEEYIDAINGLRTPYIADLKEGKTFYVPQTKGQKPVKSNAVPARLAVTLSSASRDAVAVDFLESSALTRQFIISEDGNVFDGYAPVHALRTYNGDNEDMHALGAPGFTNFANAVDVDAYKEKANGLGVYKAIEKHCNGAGPVKVKEVLNFTGEKDELHFEKGYLVQEVYIPINMLPDIAEKEELDKYLTTKTKISAISKVFVSLGDGEYAIKLSFNTEVFSVNTNRISSDFSLPALIPQTATIFAQDKNSDTYAVMQFCKDFLVGADVEADAQDHAAEIDAYNKYDGALSIPFVEYDIPDILVTRSSAIYQNSLSEMILKSEDGGAHQYCGGQEIAIEVDIMTKSEEALILLNALPRLSATYVRDYKEVLSCWPLRIDSEITKFFGINEVLIETVQIETVGGAPGLNKVSLRFTAVDRATRTREALKNIGVENMGDDSLSNAGQTNMNNYFDLKRVLGQAELYPDLCLPTIDELSYSGFRFNRYTNGKESYRTYVDPDFYFVYGYNYTSELFRQSILQGIKELSPQLRISDQYGAGIFLNQGDAKLGQPYSMRLNDIAKETSGYAQDIVTQISYEDFKREMIFSEDHGKRKNIVSFETLADLGTEFWNLTDKIRLPFREERFVNDVTQEDDKYRNTLIDISNKRIALIDDILSKPIDVEQVDKYSPLLNDGNLHNIDWQGIFSWIPGLGGLEKYDAILNNEENARQWAEKQILECAESYINEPMLKEIFGIDAREPSIWDETVHSMLLASADSATGQAFQSNIVNFQMFDSLINEKNYADYKKNWKLRPFLDLDIHNESRIQTYCRVLNPVNPNQQFAKTIEEAKSYGVGFGCFQVSKFSKETVEQLCNSSEHTAIAKSNLTNGYFLDDYYRNLQMKDATSLELEAYIGHMLYNPGYCAIAYIRNMLVWMRKLIKEEVILSMYEIIREEAFSSWMNYDADAEETNIYTEEMKLSDNVYRYFMDILMALLKKGTSYGTIHDSEDYTDEEKADALTNVLYELGIGLDIHQDIFKYKWNNIRDIEDIKAELNLVDTSTETSEQRTADYFKSIINKCLGYNADTGAASSNEADPTVLGYFSSTFILYKIQRDNEVAASLDSAAIIQKDIVFQKYSHCKGWIVAASLLTMSGFGPIYDYFLNRQVSTLDTLVSNIVMPNQSTDYTKIKKYVLALEGRKVLTVGSIGAKVYSPAELMHRTIQESIVIQRSNNVLAYLKDSYLDMIQNDKRGRMVRAFPCYYMLFVDEGRKIGVWKLHDNFYNMNAITEITVTKSRKIAADTAQIGMTNILKTFTTEEEEEQLIEQGVAGVKYDMRDAFNSIFSPRVYALQEELRRLQQTQPSKAALKPGVRIHVRLGYSADASTLPIVFNGTIAEVTNGEIVTIVAQGDGIELSNPLMDMESSDQAEHQGEFFLGKMFNTWISKGATPREILVSLMTAKGTWLQKKIREMSDGRFFNSNPHGIVHFGDPDYKEVFANGEVGQNIFEAAPGVTWGGDSGSRMVEYYNTGDIPRISVNTFGKTYWDMMHICASTQPNYMTSIVPLGLRSSVFFGAGSYYYAYDYEEVYVNDSPMIMEKRKPFQQQHIYTSYSDIIHNNIKASAKNIKTVAMGVYKENGTFGDNSKQVGPLYADYDIYPEFQKTMTVDTQYYAKGYPFIGTGFGLSANYSKKVGGGLFTIPGAKEVAWRMTASALRNSMKDMYDGELAVIGDPSVKPYDKMTIYDTYEDMSGTCEVEAVVHSFNAMTGYTTSIYADCISAVDDRFLQYAHGINLKLALTATTAQFAAIGAQKSFYHSRRLFDGSIFKWNKLSAADRLLKENLLTDAAGNILSLLSETDKQKAGKMINGVDFFRQGWYKKNGLTLNFTAHYGNLTNLVDEFTGFSKLNLIDDVFGSTQKLLSGHISAKSRGVNGALAQDIAEMTARANAGKLSGKMSADKYNKVTEAIKQLNAASTSLESATKITITGNKDLTKGIQTLIKAINSNAPTAYADDVVKGLNAMVKTSGVISSASDYRLLDDAISIARRIDGADEVADATRLIGKALLKNADTIKDTADAVRKVSKLDAVIDAFRLAKLGTVPGIIWFIVENIVFEVLAANATEWAYRYLQNLEVLQIYPMKRNSYVMTAGLSGHKGTVVGSPTYGDQGEWTKIVANVFSKKNDKTFLNSIINFLNPESVQYMADRLLENKGYPVPADATETANTKEQLINSFIANTTSLYAKRYSNNSKELAILNRLRIEDMTSEDAGKVLPDYVNYLDYPDYSVASKDIEEDLRPITSNLQINEFIKSGFLQMVHNEAGMGRVQAMSFNGETAPVPYFVDGNIYNLAVLREDAMLILEDLLYLLEKEIKNTRSQSEKNMPKRNEVMLTSATLMNEPEKGWENTGLCFRVVTPNYDIEKLAKKLEEYYKDRGATNFMLCMRTAEETEGTKPEYLFMAKPLMNRSVGNE